MCMKATWQSPTTAFQKLEFRRYRAKKTNPATNTALSRPEICRWELPKRYRGEGNGVKYLWGIISTIVWAFSARLCRLYLSEARPVPHFSCSFDVAGTGGLSNSITCIMAHDDAGTPLGPQPFLTLKYTNERANISDC